MTEAEQIDAYKHLATRVQDALVPHAPLKRTQALHVVAALYGVDNWQTLRARPQRERLPIDAAVKAVGCALEKRGIHFSEPVLMVLLGVLNK